MPRATTNKMYRNFVKGLISESGPLTFVENASTDEDNMQLFLAGNRSRRLGMEFVDDYVLSNFMVPDATHRTAAFKDFLWESVGNTATINFLVRQVGTDVMFYSVDTLVEKSFTIDLTDYYLDPTFTPGYQDQVEFASGNGFLFIVGRRFKPLIVEYGQMADGITVAEIIIKIRDFKGVVDGLANDEEPTTLTNLHRYNLLNQGWLNASNDASGSTVKFYPEGFAGTLAEGFFPELLKTQAGEDYIALYHTATGRYPGNNKQWWVAKAESDSYLPADLTLVHSQGDFVPDQLEKFYAGNNLAPRGHYIVDAFNIDRSAVSGVAGLPIEATGTRPRAIAFFAGRPFYVVDGNVYYSQILSRDKTKVGSCFQEADPTSEDISDLIATDGGVVNIPEMRHVCKAVAYKSTLVLFGSNGVWTISGGKGGFDATDFSVEKVSNFGCSSPDSIVQAGDDLYFWNESGIYTITQQVGSFGPTGRYICQSISQGVIQSWFNKHVSADTVPYVKGVFDESKNVIQWLFQEAVGGSPTDNPGANMPILLLENPYFYNRVLTLDLTLKAFFPWTFSRGPAHPIVTGFFVNPLASNPDPRRNDITYIAAVGVPGGMKFAFSQTKSYGFTDWVDRPYNSFIQTGYELLDDSMRKKEANYVFTYVKRSETEFVPEDADYDVDFPSSCLMQVKWDWTDKPGTGKWTPAHEIYRHTRFYGLGEDDLTFGDGYPVVVTKSKVRGTGRAIQFKFSNNLAGSDFDLVGWAVNYSGSSRV